MTTRRGFIQGLLALAASQTIPFNRVWSFPKEIVIVKPKQHTTYIQGTNGYYLTVKDLKMAAKQFELATMRPHPKQQWVIVHPYYHKYLKQQEII